MKNLKVNWKEDFGPFFFGLKMTGLWPDTASYGLNIYAICSLICVTLLLFVNTFFQTMELFMIKFDLDALAASLIIAAHWMVLIKICIFLKKLPIIKRLTSNLNHPDFQPANRGQMRFSQVSFSSWIRFYRVYQMSTGAVTVAYILAPMVAGSYKRHVLPTVAWYPVNTTETLYYSIIYVYQSFGMLYVATSEVNLDGIAVAFMVYIGIQCDILCDNLRRAENFPDLVKCCQHHKLTLDFFSDFNDFFGIIIFVQMFGSASTTALVMFQLSMAVPGTSEFYSVALLAVALPFEIFLYCWYGNQVETKSGLIIRAIFESQWVGNSLEFQKFLLIFGINTNEPMILTAYNLFPLSLQSFMTIMKTAWSYFAVLRQLHQQ